MFNLIYGFVVARLQERSTWAGLLSTVAVKAGLHLSGDQTRPGHVGLAVVAAVVAFVPGEAGRHLPRSVHLNSKGHVMTFFPNVWTISPAPRATEQEAQKIAIDIINGVEIAAEDIDWLFKYAAAKAPALAADVAALVPRRRRPMSSRRSFRARGRQRSPAILRRSWRGRPRPARP